VIVCVPAVKEEGGSVATPLLKSTADPKGVPSTANCTLPPLSNGL
jgi:hypothetical protein